MSSESSPGTPPLTCGPSPPPLDAPPSLDLAPTLPHATPNTVTVVHTPAPQPASKGVDSPSASNGPVLSLGLLHPPLYHPSPNTPTALLASNPYMPHTGLGLWGARSMHSPPLSEMPVPPTGGALPLNLPPPVPTLLPHPPPPVSAATLTPAPGGPLRPRRVRGGTCMACKTSKVQHTQSHHIYLHIDGFVWT